MTVWKIKAFFRADQASRVRESARLRTSFTTGATRWRQARLQLPTMVVLELEKLASRKGADATVVLGDVMHGISLYNLT